MLKQKLYVTVLLLLVCAASAAAQVHNDTIKLYFELGDPTLGKKSIFRLDSLLYADKIHAQSRLTIAGYADNVGEEGDNQLLSENRAGNVKTYLVKMGIDPRNVKTCVGKGQVQRAVKTPEGYPVDRRVDVIIEHGNNSRKVKRVPVARATPATPPISEVKTATPPVQINVENLKPGETIVLKNIYFHPGRHLMTEASVPELNMLYNTLMASPALRIQIEGHVCCVNSQDALDEDTFEMALSENRAKYIYQYLVRKGISQKRLSYRGFGRQKPLVHPEKTLEDESRNRRVEIRILE